jgi:hypothetical protein
MEIVRTDQSGAGGSATRPPGDSGDPAVTDITVARRRTLDAVTELARCRTRDVICSCRSECVHSARAAE